MVQGAILGGFAGLQGDFVKFNVAKRGKLCAIGAERFSAQKMSPTWGGVWKCAVLNTENVIFTEFLLCSGVLAAVGPLNMASAAGFFQVSCNKRHNALKEGHDGAVAVVGAALVLQRGQRRAFPLPGRFDSAIIPPLPAGVHAPGAGSRAGQHPANR